MGLTGLLVEVFHKRKHRLENGRRKTLQACDEYMFNAAPISRHSSSLAMMLKDRKLFNELLVFSQTEHCSENFELWKSVCAYQVEKNPQARKKVASRIWQDFLSSNAPKEVNVSGQTKLQVEIELEYGNCDPQLFNNVQTDVELLMADVYLRYSLSKKN
jgi:hypothetical protein